MVRSVRRQLEATAPVLPFAAPISVDAGEVAVLVSHGFTASPYSIRDWAMGFADAGYTVRAPRLPGHGTRWQDMNRTTWADWFATIEQAWLELRREHETVFVAGLSMGGGLVLRLAELYPEVAGLILVNPAVTSADPAMRLLPVLSRVLPGYSSIGSDIKRTLPDGTAVDELSYDHTPVKAAYSMWRGWRDVRADLGSIRQPVLYFRSREDHVVDDTNLPMITAGISSGDVTVVWCEDSYHVATMDADAELINAQSVAWVAAHS